MYSVGNYLELLTTTSAWHIYGSIWNTLVYTGIAYLPLMIMIVLGLKTALSNAPRGLWGINALYIIEWQMYWAFVVILLAAVPTVGVNQKELIYAEEDCVLSRSDLARRRQEHQLGEQTTFDEVRLDGETVRVPLWWWLINNFGQGLTAVATNSLPCKIDVRRLVVELEDVHIREPELSSEVARFQSECWRVAYGRSTQYAHLRAKTAQQDNERSYHEDIAWPGSHYFLNTAGYYQDIYPAHAVPSFAYNVLRDAVFAPEARATDGGWPTCAQWWVDQKEGLRTRLLMTIPESLLARWLHRFKRDKQAEERLLYTLLHVERETGTRVISDNLTQPGLLTNVADTGSKLLGAYGAVSRAPSVAAVFNVLRDSAPILHAVVMLVLVVALPFILMAGAYSPERTIRLSLVFLSVLFWGFLFKLVFWVDTTLGHVLFYQNWTDVTILSTVRWVFNGVMFSLYFSVPILFTRWASTVGGDFGLNAAAALESVGSSQILTNKNRSQQTTDTK